MLDKLYENIGAKIKYWAELSFLVEAIAAIGGGIALIAEEEIAVGIPLMVIGPIVAWVLSWFLYAFGELVEKTAANERNTSQILKALQAENQKPNRPVAQNGGSDSPKSVQRAASQLIHSWRCDNCGEMTTKSPCEYCGK